MTVLCGRGGSARADGRGIAARFRQRRRPAGRSPPRAPALERFAGAARRSVTPTASRWSRPDAALGAAAGRRRRRSAGAPGRLRRSPGPGRWAPGPGAASPPAGAPGTTSSARTARTEVLREPERDAPRGLPLDYVIVDDGYQKAIGDWLTLAPDQLQRHGEAGRQSIARRRPARRHLGGALRPGRRFRRPTPRTPIGRCATTPARPSWAGSTSARTSTPWTCRIPTWPPGWRTSSAPCSQEWGYDLFKIDFLFAACAAGRRHDAAHDARPGLRRGLEIIRAAIGDEAFLLGCGAPQAPCVGVVDGMRVGPDVAANWHPFWARPVAAFGRECPAQLHRPLLHARPAVGQRPRLRPGARARRFLRPGAERDALALAGIIALLGGATISSDHLPGLRKGRFKYLAQMLPPTGDSAPARWTCSRTSCPNAWCCRSAGRGASGTSSA